MKKIIMLLTLLFWMLQTAFAQPLDSTNMNRIDALDKKMDAVESAVAKIKVDTAIAQSKCPCNAAANTLDPVHWVLIFSPFILFLIVFSFVVFGATKGFSFIDALTENELPKKIIKNPEYNAAIIAAGNTISNLSVLFPPTIEVSNVLPTLVELKAIVTAKQSALEMVTKALPEAQNAEQKLKDDVTSAEAGLKVITDNRPALDAAVISAQMDLDTANGAAAPDAAIISAAKEALINAQKLVADNETARVNAQAQLDLANKAVKDNAATIVSLTEMRPKLTEELKEAKQDVEQAGGEKNSGYTLNAYRPSISRYIAFITSLVTIIIVLCMSSFFIYHYIRTGCPPDFGALTTIVIALGLGVTPYITNKISTAASANR